MSRAEPACAPVPMVAVHDVTRTFGSGAQATRALRGVSATIGRGQLAVLRGRSGSGKTTLLNIIGGLDAPDSGSVHVGGADVTAMSDEQRLRLRRTQVAYIFQTFGLIPDRKLHRPCGRQRATLQGVTVRAMNDLARLRRVACHFTACRVRAWLRCAW